jgi:hypothetical protein
MISVIIEPGGRMTRLPPLLAQLTAGAVEGLVRQVVVVGDREGLLDALCADTGADAAPDFAAAVAQARGPYVLALAAAFRFREGWVEALGGFIADGGRVARVRGRGGPFAASGVLVERGCALGAADLQGLRRHGRLRARHIG